MTEDIRQLQIQRIQYLQRACDDKELFKNVAYNRKTRMIYYYTSRYDFSYCKVPKVGCTFWTQVFTILRKGSNASKDIVGLKRNAVHARLGGANHISFESKTRHKSRTVLVSRDPYSRLFSAFIDKMFLPTMYGTAVSIVKRQRTSRKRNLSCANDITFEEFLSDIIDSARVEGKSLNRHWAPIFSLCNPCDVNVLSLVKQETFSVDVEYVLKEVRIANDEFDVIYDALHDHRIETTLPGIVATVVDIAAKDAKNCMSRMEVARRIWVSFQIQGYIKEDIPFPTNTINSNEKAKNPNFLTKVILETIEKHPMSSNDSKIQRRRALVKAYDGLSEGILDKVQKLYKQDFILFDYSFERPSLKHG